MLIVKLCVFNNERRLADRRCDLEARGEYCLRDGRVSIWQEEDGFPLALELVDVVLGVVHGARLRG